MSPRERLDQLHAEMTDWRRDFHAHPEIGFEEARTSEIVAQKLGEWGIEVHRGLGGTGVVGVIRGQGQASGGNRAIGLRADMDALDMQEGSGVPWASRNAGKHHACGHDGHTTMLLGAAQHLARTRNFDGTVYVIFQPAARVTHDYEFDKGTAKWFLLERNRAWTVLTCYSAGALWLLAPLLLATEIAVSLQALWDTWGLGVGVGATRASNGVVAVFSNSGIAGGLSKLLSKLRK